MNSYITVLCCFVIVVILIDSNKNRMKIIVKKKNNLRNKTKNLNNVRINHEIIPVYQNHYQNNHNINNINNKVLDYTLSNDIKHLLPVYSCPEYYNEKTKKGVIRDVDELMTGDLLKLK